MRDVDAPVEDARSPKDDVFLADEVVLLHPFEGSRLKPDEVHDAVTVGEVSNEVALASTTFLLETQDFTHYLHERHVGRKLMNVVEPCAVDVFVREVV